MPSTLSLATALDRARSVLAIEARALDAMALQLGPSFLAAVEALFAVAGRVVVTGMGKSGHIARKIAATFASTGTPALFVHPAEARHGDLGMVAKGDVVIALSHSGESEELIGILPLVKRRGVTLIAITGRLDSALARESDIVLDAGVAQEACPLNLAPTASTTAALAMGDALAVVLLEARGFSADDFATTHPGGRLGRRLLTRVQDVMRPLEAVPQVAESATLEAAMRTMSAGGLGMTVVNDANGRIAGIFTDGDLRRTLLKSSDIQRTTLAAYLNRTPKSIAPERLAVDAVALMEEHKVSQMLVVDDQGALLGAFNTHDLLRAGVM